MMKEPMLHFVVGALLLYLLFNVMLDKSPRSSAQTVSIDNQLLNTLGNSFRLQHLRQPSDGELAGLLNDYIEEEALVREAMRLKLDQDDPVIRRRLIQKLQFLFQDLDDQVPVTTLTQYYQLHASRYLQPATLDFEHVYYQGDPPTLNDFTRNHSAGDAFALGNEFIQENVDMIRGTFGAPFVNQLETLPLNRWQGPLASPYGFHFIRVRKRTPPQQRPFAEITEEVKADFLREQQLQFRQRNISRIVSRQALQIDPDVAPLLSQRSIN